MDWFEDESFWESLETIFWSPERYEQGAEQVEKILHLTGVERGDVLDLCCGPGRHAMPLARRGFRVTAVDRSPFLLAKARAAAAAANVSIEWVEEDMRRFERADAFDLAINIYTSFGYFKDPEDDHRVLRNVYASLKSGGRFVIDMMGKECLARRYHETVSSEGPDGSILVERHHVAPDWGRLENEWILVRGETARTFTFDLTLYSGVELTERLAESGFSDVRLFGDLDGLPYGAEAKRLIAVARK